jgi:hypothetical protein
MVNVPAFRARAYWFGGHAACADSSFLGDAQVAREIPADEKTKPAGAMRRGLMQIWDDGV